MYLVVELGEGAKEVTDHIRGRLAYEDSLQYPWVHLTDKLDLCFCTGAEPSPLLLEFMLVLRYSAQ